MSLAHGRLPVALGSVVWGALAALPQSAGSA